MELRLSLLLIGCLIAAIELGVSASEQSMDQLQEIGLPLDKVEPYKTQEDSLGSQPGEKALVEQKDEELDEQENEELEEQEDEELDEQGGEELDEQGNEDLDEQEHEELDEQGDEEFDDKALNAEQGDELDNKEVETLNEQEGIKTFNEQEDVTMNKLPYFKARTLVRGIRYHFQKHLVPQYSALCLVPTRMVRPTYRKLLRRGLCSRIVVQSRRCRPLRRPRFYVQYHRLLRTYATLRNKYYNDPWHMGQRYDVFLYTYKSPCPTCARGIVSAVQRLRYENLLDGFYISYSKIHRRKGKSTLKLARMIFREYNERPDTTKSIILRP
ncbi:hypothetical protein EMCRGX_G000229 [Ephydatia muelleri]|eukprot:Em0001g137a